MEVSSSKIKKCLIFPEMELSRLIFFLCFRKELSELKKLEKTLLLKNFLYIGIWNFLVQSLKNSYISGGNLQRPEKQTKVCPEEISCLLSSADSEISKRRGGAI